MTTNKIGSVAVGTMATAGAATAGVHYVRHSEHKEPVKLFVGLGVTAAILICGWATLAVILDK